MTDFDAPVTLQSDGGHHASGRGSQAAAAEQTSISGTRPVIGTVRKQFDFPAAHTNGHHRGAARSDFGMVVDFGDLKHVYRDRVEPIVEHQDLDLTLAHLPERTVELIAAWILSQLHSVLPCVFKVRVCVPES